MASKESRGELSRIDAGESREEAAGAIIVLDGEDGKPESVVIPKRRIKDAVVAHLFRQTDTSDRDAVLANALRIGSVALLDDRISAALEDADQQIRGRFRQLDMLMDLRRSRWDKGTDKGEIGEEWVGTALARYASRNGWDDRFERTGTATGELASDDGSTRNKSGDIIAVTDRGKRIAIEVKFASIPEGSLATRDYASSARDSAWSQIVEAMANRNCEAGFIVFDRKTMNKALRKTIPDLGYLEGAGLVCVVDWESGDRANLYAAYAITRSLIHTEGYTRQPEVIGALITQARAVIEKLKKLDRHVTTMRKAARDLDKAIDALEDEMVEHNATLDAIGKQIDAARDRDLTAEDQHFHYLGEGITTIVKAHQKRRRASDE